MDGSVNDASGGGNNGNIVGDPFFVSGVSGSGIYFDGMDDYVMLANESTFDLTEFTLAATVYVEDTETVRAIISKGPSLGNYNIRVLGISDGNPEKVGFSYLVPQGNFSTLVSNQAIQVGEFFHVAVTYRSDLLKTYFNGISQQTVSNPPLPLLNDSDVTIGASFFAFAAPVFMKGIIDNVRIYNRALSDDEVTELFLADGPTIDSDGDGIPDVTDVCPASFGIPANNGCPATPSQTEHKLLAADGAAGDLFGQSVAVSGDYAIVGAHLHDSNGIDAGAAYIIRRTGTTWVQETKLVASDGTAGEWFGYSVAIDGNLTLVGVPRDEVPGLAGGSGYVFERQGAEWVEIARLTSSANQAQALGWSVSISGDYAMLGSPGDDVPADAAGAAYVFQRQGATWIEMPRLLASDGASGDEFGRSVSINGDVAIVGSIFDNDLGSNSGSAYVFRREGATWVESAKLIPSDGAAGDFFGVNVSVNDNFAVVGAYHNTENGGSSGSAYMFEWNGSSWPQATKLTASDGTIGDQFGKSVSIDNDLVVVGTESVNGLKRGSTYVYQREGDIWSELENLTASDGSPNDLFGSSVAIDSLTLIAGAPSDDALGTDAGSAYILTLQVGEAILALDRSSILFEDTFTTESREESVTINNTGASDLLISSIEILGPDASAFESSPGNGTIASSATDNLLIRFNPIQLGLHQAVAVVSSNASTSPDSIALRGTGVSPILDFTPVREAASGQGQLLGVVLTPPSFQPDTRWLYYRRAGDISYDSTALVQNGAQYEGVLPSDVITLQGVEYYFRFSDGEITSFLPLVDPTTRPFGLRVSVSSFLSPVALVAQQPTMVSVPLTLANPSAMAVLGDNLGDTYDFLSWRIFRWDAQSEDYEEIPEGEITPGQAYWLITRDGGTFDVGAGTSADLDQPIEIGLAPGWNQIANPYAFPVDWALVQGSAGVEAPVGHDGADYAYNQTSLEPWQGYFVFNPLPDPTVLSFSPQSALRGANKQAAPAKRARADSSAGYRLQLEASLADGSIKSATNVLALADQADSGFDALDSREAPGFGPHVRLSSLAGGVRLAGNVKPMGEGGQWWDLELAVERPRDLFRTSETVTVRLGESGIRPEGFLLYALDQSRQELLVLRDNRFSVHLDATHPVVSIRLILGTESFAQQSAMGTALTPAETALEQNFPNPFRERTSIDYQLHETLPVRLEVYNILGQEIALLRRAEQPAGVYRLEWDGRDNAGRQMPSGVYFYRLAAGGEHFTRSLTLVR